MTQCQIYGMNRLINHDFPRAYTLIVAQFETEEFTVEDVLQAYAAIKVHNEELNFVKEGAAKHRLSKPIAQLRDERHEYLLSLRGRVVYSLKSHVDGERKAAIVIDEWLEKEHKFLRSKSIQKQAESVNRLAHDITLMPELATHLETLGISSAMDSLVSVSKQLDTLYLMRNAEKKAATRKAKQIRDDAYAGMKTFVQAIEQAIKLTKGDIGQHLNYFRLIDGIMTDFDSAQMSMETRRKKAAEEAKANQEANPENGEQETGGNDEPNGGKPAMASRKRTFNVPTLNGMDLHNGTTGESMEGRAAMSGSVTNGGANNDATDGAKKPMAGNGQMADNALDGTDKGGTTNENDSEPES